MAPDIDEHKNFLHSKDPEKADDWITREQMRTFTGWLQKRAMHDGDIEDDLYSLSQLPSSNIMTFKGYEINGNTFYMIAQDKKSTNKTVVSALMQKPRWERKHIRVIYRTYGNLTIDVV